jgi:hypothetical protein
MCFLALEAYVNEKIVKYPERNQGNSFLWLTTKTMKSLKAIYEIDNVKMNERGSESNKF